MKKFWILTVLLILTGCVSTKEKVYYSLVDELKNVQVSTTNLPYDINVSLDKITDDEIMYNVIVDNPKEKIYDISVLVMDDKNTDTIYPSIGIFDNKVNLIPNEINEEKNNVKGIALVGYLNFLSNVEDYKGTFKVLISYTNQKGENIKDYYIYQV